jgi:hypothetical protein
MDATLKGTNAMFPPMSPAGERARIRNEKPYRNTTKKQVPRRGR